MKYNNLIKNKLNLISKIKWIVSILIAYIFNKSFVKK